MSEIQVPSRISPCPISEAIFEIRYNCATPEAVFGLIHGQFKDDYPRLEKQPILQIPEPIRNADPNLMYLPEYRMAKGSYQVLIGPRTFGIAVVGEYDGWTAFFERISTALNAVHRLGMIDSVHRLGLRYINTFDFDIFTASTLQIARDGQPLGANSMQLTATIPAGIFQHHLRVVSNVEIRNQERVFRGSAIDIDTATEGPIENFFDHALELIAVAHTEEKKLFFSLLTEDFVRTLNPDYAEV